jgi:hypothetical protein
MAFDWQRFGDEVRATGPAILEAGAVSYAALHPYPDIAAATAACSSASRPRPPRGSR